MAEPVDPRITRTRATVLAAARDLLAEVGFGNTTIEGVAERSGVARSTIYRHWPDRSRLLVDAVQEMTPSFELTEEGDLRSDLLTIMNVLAAALAQPQISRLIGTLQDAATRDPELAVVHSQFTTARRRPALVALRRAIDRGQVDPATDIDEMVTVLVSPLFFQRFYSHEPFDRRFIERHVDRVLKEIALSDYQDAVK